MKINLTRGEAPGFLENAVLQRTLIASALGILASSEKTELVSQVVTNLRRELLKREHEVDYYTEQCKK